MLKRLSGLLLFALLGWLIWRWWQERSDDRFVAGPQLAPTVLPPERADQTLPEPTPALPVSQTEPVEMAYARPPIGQPERSEPEVSADTGEEDDSSITGYCVRCRAKRQMQDPQVETTENGRRGARGTCPVCGSTMFRFLKEVKVEEK